MITLMKYLFDRVYETEFDVVKTLAVFVNSIRYDHCLNFSDNDFHHLFEWTSLTKKSEQCLTILILIIDVFLSIDLDYTSYRQAGCRRLVIWVYLKLIKCNSSRVNISSISPIRFPSRELKMLVHRPTIFVQRFFAYKKKCLKKILSNVYTNVKSFNVLNRRSENYHLKYRCVLHLIDR